MNDYSKILTMFSKDADHFIYLLHKNWDKWSKMTGTPGPELSALFNLISRPQGKFRPLRYKDLEDFFKVKKDYIKDKHIHYCTLQENYKALPPLDLHYDTPPPEVVSKAGSVPGVIQARLEYLKLGYNPKTLLRATKKNEIEELEQQIAALTKQLEAKRKSQEENS